MAEIKDEQGNIRRTDATIKGDIFDLLLSIPKREYEPRQYSDYPETVLEALRQFHTLWAFPEAGIPSKKQKGLFERWAAELQKLTDLCGSDAKLKLAMKKAFDNYDSAQHKHLIKSPISVYSDLITAVAELNREEREIIVAQDVVPVESKPADATVVDASIKRMKNLLRKDDE